MIKKIWWLIIPFIILTPIFLWIVYRLYRKTCWKCIPATSSPVRRNFWGDIECMSIDGKNCLYNCPNVDPVSPDIPLTCGSNHKKLYGVTGYDTQGHWCQVGDRSL